MSWAEWTDQRYGSPEEGIFRVSQSHVSLYLKCGILYYYKILEKIPRISSRMAIGTGVAKGARADNCSKRERGVALKKKDVVEISVTGFEEEVEKCEVLDKYDKGQAKDDTSRAAGTYSDEVSPITKDIIAEERSHVFYVGEGIEICGTPDVITKQGLGDYKTGQRVWTQDRADTSIQLSSYGILHNMAYGTYPGKLWIDSIYKTSKKGWQYVRVFTTRNQQDYKAFLLTVRQMRAAIKAGVFHPAPPDAWWCSAKWCEYHATCPYACKGGNNGSGE